MKFNNKQREDLVKASTGLTVESLEYIEDGNYWVMTFTNGTETSFRFMAELI